MTDTARILSMQYKFMQYVQSTLLSEQALWPFRKKIYLKHILTTYDVTSKLLLYIKR